MHPMFSTRFISVSNALPKTSYVKMIDIWLLFNLTIPFAEVIFLLSSFPPCQGALTNLHWVLAWSCRGQEDDQPSRTRSWSWPRSHDRDANPSETCHYSRLWLGVSFAKSYKVCWMIETSFYILCIFICLGLPMENCFQSTSRSNVRHWRVSTRGGNAVKPRTFYL